MFQFHLGKKIYIIFILGLLSSFLEGIGILMLLPLLQNLDSVKNINPDESIINKLLLDLINYFELGGSISSILLFITIAFILKGIISFSSLSFSAYLRGVLLFKLKKQLFQSYTKMTYSYYSKNDTGYFSNIINEQPTKGLEAFNQITILGGQFVNSIVLLSLAVIMTWIFGIMAIVSGLILLFLFIGLNSFVRKLSRITAQENGVLTKWLIQSLHGFKYLVATSQFSKLKARVLRSIDILTKNQIRSGYAAAFTQTIREPIAVVFIMLVIYIQIFILNQNLEPILVSVVLFYRSLNSVLAVQSFFQGTFQHIGSMELVDNELKNQFKNKDKDGSLMLGKFSSSIKFVDVSFSYRKNEDILKNISFEIPFLKTVGIVGSSGSGKSTILDLISLVHKNNSGNILIDNINSLKIHKSSWRKQIGYVSQDTVVFDDSIANNISMWEGDFNNKSIYNKVLEAAKAANIFDFINDQKNGFNTLVGERGILLSGGQRQRLFIARELFRNPRLLLLDEATSALDSESEKVVQESIDKLKGKITTVIVAHRLSTLKNVDLIYIIDNGKIIDKGTFKKLMSDNSHFKKLVNLQKL
tara:strand:+ start:1394 stop:3151 length:1758 start_codon:yes stop_codon:yes gene_type:complete